VICTAHQGDQIKKNVIGGACSMYWGSCVYRVSVGKREENGPLRRPMRRWEDNIKMNLQKVGFFFIISIPLC
jgi:hypothetical protein